MSPSRLRLVSVLGLWSANALVVLAWSQPWLDARTSASGTVAQVAVPGSTVGGAELPLALTGIAAVAALLLSGPVFRGVLSVLQALLGLCVAIAAALPLADPAVAARASVAASTGIEAPASEIAAAATAWPGIALALGVLLVVGGIAVAATSRGWPAATSRYSRTRAIPSGEDSIAPDPMTQWDEITRGTDPTDTDPTSADPTDPPR